MGNNPISGLGPSRLLTAIPKDPNGMSAAAIYDHPLNQPRLHYVMTLVSAGDVGTNYVSGSVGLYKTIKVYETSSSAGDAATMYTLKYQDASAPSKVTDLVISDTTV